MGPETAILRLRRGLCGAKIRAFGILRGLQGLAMRGIVLGLFPGVANAACVENSITFDVIEIPSHLGTSEIPLLFDGLKTYGNGSGEPYSNLRIHDSGDPQDNVLLLQLGAPLPAGSTFTLYWENDDADGQDAQSIAENLNDAGYGAGYYDRNGDGALTGADFDVDGDGDVTVGSGDMSPLGVSIRFYDGNPRSGGTLVGLTYSPIKPMEQVAYSNTTAVPAAFDHIMIESNPDGTGTDPRFIEIELNRLENTGSTALRELSCMAVRKTDDISGLSIPQEPGDVLNWTIEVENIGTFALSGLSLLETLTDADGNPLALSAGPTYAGGDVDGDGVLDADETFTYSASYTITQGDIQAGGVRNTVSAAATDSEGRAISVVSDDPDDPTGDTDPTSTPLSATIAPVSCSPVSVFAQPRTQLAGSGSASAIGTSDVYVFDNVATDANGNPMDAVFRLLSKANTGDVFFQSSDNTIAGRFVATDNPYITYSIGLVEDGSATAANPLGIPADQSQFGGAIIRQTDVDSSGTNRDSSDVAGFFEGAPIISFFNTAILEGFPAPVTAIAEDPAKVGDPTNWSDEPNEDLYDNYVEYEYPTFVNGTFLHGYTGTETTTDTRGGGIELCTIPIVRTMSADDDDFSSNPVSGVTGGTAGNVLEGDSNGGDPVDAAEVTTIVVSSAIPPAEPEPYISTDPASEGDVIAPPGTAAGTYTLTYRICQDSWSQNCGQGTVTVVVTSGGGVTGQVYVDLDSDDGFDTGEPLLAGIVVALYDDAGTPADPADDTLLASTETGADGAYAFAGLAEGATHRIEVDTADPDLPADARIGTTNPLTGIAVAEGEVASGFDFGFETRPADLSVILQARDPATRMLLSEAGEGDTVEWVIQLTNAGPGSPSGVALRAVIPNGFAFVSDDAAATGGSYDPGSGLWVADEILPGVMRTLVITTTVLGEGDRTATAEIVSSSLADPDSDPAADAAIDDLADGAEDDDEARLTIPLTAPVRTIGGRVFIDNGAGGGSAHDGFRNGAEIGTQAAGLTVLDGDGTVLGTPVIAADGRWQMPLDPAYAGSLTVTLVPATGHLAISESGAALPGLVNADPHDGMLAFTAAAGADYADIDFGLVRAGWLAEDQTATIEAGQSLTLAHDYHAQSAATVGFSYADMAQTPESSFSATLFRDDGCDGSPDSPIADPVAVAAGDRICLISRIVASAGAGPGASLSYALQAVTSYAGTAVVSTDSDTDRVTVAAGQGQLVLSKTVRNVTQNTPEGAANAGAVGDVLEYRIYLANPSSQTVGNMTIHDRTPAYTRLVAPLAATVALGPEMSCALTAPLSNVSGYAGPLEWGCSGSFRPGDAGAIGFRVEIAP